MQHGALTPLGRQLRAVLANLSVSPIAHRQHRTRDPRPSELQRNGARSFSHTSTRSSQATATASQIDAQSPISQPPIFRQRTHSQRRLKKRFQPDNEHLTEALQSIGNHAAAPYLPNRPSKINLSYADAKSKRIWSEYDARRQRVLTSPSMKKTRPVSLQRLTSIYMRRKAETKDDLVFGGEHSDLFSAWEIGFLRYYQYTVEDVAAWADIVSKEDALAAATTLSDRLRSHGPHSIPIWLLLYLLRRPFVSARALRLFMAAAPSIIDYWTRSTTDSGKYTEDVFLAATRLIRHAREVWPQALKMPVNMMLQHLQDRELREGPFTNHALSNITYLLNMMMHLVSISTALQPFKDSVYQEAALVPILQYMSEHSPSLHINRQGYRAVVRIQLLHRKTAEEQQWAELKSLSWPPWKVDRTAMDTTIGPEHGITKAGATLLRMREAGYRPLYWEKLAQVCTGWDVDRTPTVQLRVLLNPPGLRHSNKLQGDSEPWAARIQSTRTIQEAWACYLAWEDKRLPPDQDVYLAIFHKLLEEGRRQHRESKESWHKPTNVAHWPLLPGDGREISPPPPSTHLYTYTKTAPPTVTEFYQMLVNHGVVLEGHCLAFVVLHANSLQEGLERLQAACSRYPAIQSLVTLSPVEDIFKVPGVIFTAAVKLFAESPRTSLSKTLSHMGLPTVEFEGRPELFPRYRVNYDNPVLHAIELLRMRRVFDRELWSGISHRLTRASKRMGLSNTMDLDTFSSVQSEKSDTLSQYHRRCKGALNAFRLIRHIVDLQQRRGIDLDGQSFHALCVSTENAATAWWSVLHEDAASPSLSDTSARFRMLWRDAVGSGRSNRVQGERLKHEFKVLVGSEQTSTHSREELATGRRDYQDEVADSADMPKLLTIPSPNDLHAYIRALGWLADFDGLLDTVYWMREYHTELRERQYLDRLGAHAMRRTIVALRVFLERTWIHNATPAPDPDDVGQYESEDEKDQAAALLTMVRSCADPALVEEVKEVVESVEDWGGWPSHEEVEAYAADKRFQQFRSNDTRQESLTLESTSAYSPLAG